MVKQTAYEKAISMFCITRSAWVKLPTS